MKIDDMNDAEKAALAGLVRTMIRIDGEFNAEESAALSAAAEELGEEAFWGLLEGPTGRRRDVRELAREVSRREAQESIYGLLYGLATSQTITSRENDLLEWLATTWELEIADAGDDSDAPA